ncbi:hypothetical protein KGF57_002895 [Candida theae]|uniref:Cell wall mannoprotein PIR1-like C-terminal domain-containing protein n=1 Tax=Candida theae TaxID=1198502 RepID=A0AAD5BEC8_9ASCO|nr:uncharacterized protein KGF57_002895 [Candida theae]KAI5958087.1 hypothetical protein KGF57_002895 [Candida theae]
MLSPRLLASFATISLIQAYYIPASGEDWSKYKPTCDYLPGSFTSLPFKFGIVVNPYTVTNEGELLEPEVKSIERSITTSFVTSVVTPAPKETKTKDIIVQITDGQVQKVNEELCDFEEKKKLGLDEDEGYWSDKNNNDGDFHHDKEGKFGNRKHFDDKPGKEKEFDAVLSKRDESDIVDAHDVGGDIKDKSFEEHSKHYKEKHGLKNGHEDLDFDLEKGEKEETEYYNEHQKSKEHESHSDSYSEHRDFKERGSGHHDGNEHHHKDHKGNHNHLDGDEFRSPVYSVACYTNATLRMTLRDSILRDSDGRIGCIVSGHQFQFDGPTPQHGAVFAAGWSVTKDGQLALGNSTKFYQCASGHFYNLYDQSIGFQCHPVTLDVVELIDC